MLVVKKIFLCIHVLTYVGHTKTCTPTHTYKRCKKIVLSVRHIVMKFYIASFYSTIVLDTQYRTHACTFGFACRYACTLYHKSINTFLVHSFCRKVEAIFRELRQKTDKNGFLCSENVTKTNIFRKQHGHMQLFDSIRKQKPVLFVVFISIFEFMHNTMQIKSKQ